MKPTQAKEIAQAGLIHIAADAELVMAMVSQSGADVSDIRAMASRPEFAVFVLDFLMESDERLLAFAATAGLRPEQVQMARAALGGFDMS